MEHNRIPLPTLATPGEVTTFYAYEDGAARNAMLAALAMHLAGAPPGALEGARTGLHAGTPVLMIDWDLDAPALHRHFDLPAGGEADAAARAGAEADFDSDPGARMDGGAVGETRARARPGLLEFFDACRMRLRRESPQRTGAGSDDALAERVLDAADWQDYVERADQRRPLYLMRAGRVDDN